MGVTMTVMIRFDSKKVNCFLGSCSSVMRSFTGLVDKAIDGGHLTDFRVGTTAA